jgi:two-component system response regulator FixJ
MPADPVIHVIDDDDAARDSLVFLLKSSNFSVRMYESGVAFLGMLPGIELGCIITDVRMPEIDGLELLRRLRAQQIALPVIVITGQGDVPLALEAIKLGAADFIEKPYDHETILNAIQLALGTYSGSIKPDSEIASIKRQLAELSPIEQKVLSDLVTGQPNVAIAHKLGIDQRTVETCRASIMTKMQVESLPRLIRMMLRIAQHTSQ